MTHFEVVFRSALDKSLAGDVVAVPPQVRAFHHVADSVSVFAASIDRYLAGRAYSDKYFSEAALCGCLDRFSISTCASTTMGAYHGL
jgi:hypothetical protein